MTSRKLHPTPPRRPRAVATRHPGPHPTQPIRVPGGAPRVQVTAQVTRRP